MLLASPSNPTGTSILPDELRGILAEVRRRNGFAILDEIYQGLSYDAPPVVRAVAGRQRDHREQLLEVLAT